MVTNQRHPNLEDQLGIRKGHPDVIGVIMIWEQARVAYNQLLIAGPDRSDVQLSQDAAYAALLAAALELFRTCGPQAVLLVADYLAETAVGGRNEHFTRFWSGLMPKTAPTAFHRLL